MTTHISQESTPVQCNILVLVGWSEEENCLLADHSEEVQLVYLFCIILTNTKTPAVAQGTMLDQIWVPVTGNCRKYFGSQLGLLITSQLLQVFIKVIEEYQNLSVTLCVTLCVTQPSYASLNHLMRHSTISARI